MRKAAIVTCKIQTLNVWNGVFLIVVGFLIGLIICTGLYLWVNSTAGYDHQIIKVGDVEWICLEQAGRIVSCETVDYF